ncbi:MAG: thioredoxin family protein [Bdellovibrionaceae bacterium]|nr:thioredoxin family protein [Bdellovibrionales bacterium]MCB9084496.1 thioredoxin family protein [Pseudobdellovibrionaceae bacterium]
MALTYTPNAELGKSCPEFSLPSVDGKTVSLADFADAKVLVVMFICAHCPYVQAIEERLIELGQSFPRDQVQLVGICSNDWADYPEDSPENLFKRWKERNYSFPYLIDEDQSVAGEFGAVCTPDLFVYNSQRRLAYRGRLDDSWKEPKQVTQQDLRRAIECLLANQNIDAEQIPSVGCSIKWKQ